MTRRRTHTAHRFRVISRCPTCRGKLLSACTYRSRRGGACIETRDERVMLQGRRAHLCPSTGARFVYDLPREARRIFAKIIAPGIGMEIGE